MRPLCARLLSAVVCYAMLRYAMLYARLVAAVVAGLGQIALGLEDTWRQGAARGASPGHRRETDARPTGDRCAAAAATARPLGHTLLSRRRTEAHSIA